MVKTAYDCLIRVAELDNIVCCFVWPVTVLWNFWSFPRLRQSVITKLRLIGMLFMTTIFCMLLLSAISWKVLNNNICSKIGYKFCEMLHGPAPVYRIYFSLFLFFLLLAIIMFGVKSSNSCRALLHNKFWTLKTIALLCLIFGFILIPRSPYTGEVWHFFGLNAAFAYIVLQFILLLDATHTVNSKIVNWIDDSSHQETSGRYCYFVLWLPTSFFYIVTILVVANFYKTYSSRTDCITNLFFISFHVYMCASATFISIHPVIQAAKPKSGLLQSSVVCAYSSYTLWLTLSNEPDEVCNPTREYLYPTDPLQNFQILFSIILAFFILVTFSIRIVQHPQYGKHIKTNTTENDPESDCKEAGIHRFDNIIRDDELYGVEYSYSFFLITLSFASLYLMMSITNWYRPEEEENLTVKLLAGWGAVWIKLCGGVFCVFLYIWSLVAPVIFPHSYKNLCFYEIIFSTTT